MGSAVTPDLSKGGTIDGDITITGDFKVEGGGSFTYEEILEGSLNVETSINGVLATFNQTHASGLGMLIKATGTGSSEYLLKLQGNAGSTEAMFVGKDGKVGIGAVSPVEKLDVSGDILSTGYVTILQNQFLRADNSAVAGINSNRIKLKNSSTGNMEFTLESNDWDFAFTNGKVGIGTTSPVEKLDISAGNIRLDNQQMLTFATTDSESGRVGIQGDESSDFLRFRTDNTNRMAITNSGVGIYTLSPNSDYSLTVQQPTGTNKDYLLGIQDNGSNTAFKIDTDSGDNVALRLFNGSGAEKIYFNVGGHSRIGNSANTNTITFDTANGSIYSNTTSLYLSSNNANSALTLSYKSGTATPTLQANSGGNIGILSNLGVGTDAPTHKLHVKGSGNTGQDFFLITDSDNNNQFRVDSSSADGSPHMRLYDTSGT